MADRKLADGQKGIGALRQRLAFPAVLVGVVFLTGVVGYRLIGGSAHSWLEAFYMTANVLTTTGFREAIPVEGSAAAQFFTIALMLFGAAVVVYATSVVTAFIVEGDLTEGFRRRRMQQAIEAMSGHFIVCGAGQAGLAVLGELTSTQREAVLIESDPHQTERAGKLFPAVPVLSGDFTDDEMLVRAGIARAAGIVMCVDDDKDALVGTVTARQLNPSLRIVARATDEHAMTRLRNAGADAVVSPGIIGGMRLASELVRPSVVGFLDQMLRDKDRNLRIEEVEVPDGSPFAGRTVGELDARRTANLMLLAVRSPGTGNYVYNPDSDMRIAVGSRLIVMGAPEGVTKLRDLSSGNHIAVAGRGTRGS